MPSVCVKIAVYGLVKFIFFLKPFLGAGRSFQLDWVKGRSQVCVQLNLGYQCSPEGEGAVGRPDLRQPSLVSLNRANFLMLNYADSNLYKSVFCV